MTYTFRWGRKAVDGKHDPMHTISGIERDAFLDYWTSTLRAGTPWQLIETETGLVIRWGSGSIESTPGTPQRVYSA